METATYCPEDNKLRLYVGRVPRDEYEKLRAQGWICTPKQDCDFVATWTPERENTALEYSNGILEDEDQTPQDRAADRAERFGEYRDKRTDEAAEAANKYETGPQLHGYQSAALAERKAGQLDRIGGRAVNLWEKAEYWQYRTAGVISHALHVSTPGVRMGRIKELEAQIRKMETNNKEYKKRFEMWRKIVDCEDAEKAHKWAYALANMGGDYGHDYPHPRQAEFPAEHIETKLNRKCGLWHWLSIDCNPITGHEAAILWLSDHPAPIEGGGRWLNHYRLRLAYENQMLEAQGGRAAFVEMEAGGWIGKHQIQKVNKSPVTGRVVSVQVWGTTRGFTKESGYKIEETRAVLITLNIERLKTDVYRAPTNEERKAFIDEKNKAKKDQAENGAKLINLTPDDAKRIQTQMNAEAVETDKGKNYPRKPGEIAEMTQAKYSGMFKDYKAIQEYRGIKIRVCVHGWQHVESVVILADKPQKTLPVSFWNKPEPKQIEVEQKELAV